MIFFQIIKLTKIYKSKVRQELELRRNKRENKIIIKYNKRNPSIIKSKNTKPSTKPTPLKLSIYHQNVQFRT